MISRRKFGAGLVGMGIAARIIPRDELAVPQEPRKNTLMHVGGDYHSVNHLQSKPLLGFVKRRCFLIVQRFVTEADSLYLKWAR